MPLGVVLVPDEVAELVGRIEPAARAVVLLEPRKMNGRPLTMHENASSCSPLNVARATMMPWDSRSSPSFKIGRSPRFHARRQARAASSGVTDSASISGSFGRGIDTRSPSQT
jgi:hypothetical protein